MARTKDQPEPVVDLRDRLGGGDHEGEGNAVRRRDDDPRGRTADRPQDIPRKGWKDVLIRVKNDVRDDNVSLLAAGVAFYFLLALIPGLVAVVSIYGLFAEPSDVQTQIEDVAAGMPVEAQNLLRTQLESIVNSSTTGLSIGAIVGVLAALWSASAGMRNLITAVNVAYDESEERKFLKQRGFALLATVVFVAGSVFAFTLIALLPGLLEDTALGEAAKWAFNILRWPTLFVLYMLGLAALYRFAPNRDQARWQWVSWGAVAATVLWVVGSIVFSVYSANFGSFNETYGSMAAVVLLMLWLMLTAFTIVFGAELNSELEHQTAKDSTVGADRPMGQRGAEMADTIGESQ